MTEETIKQICYTKEEVDSMIAFAVEEARRIDEASNILDRIADRVESDVIDKVRQIPIKRLLNR